MLPTFLSSSLEMEAFFNCGHTMKLIMVNKIKLYFAGFVYIVV